MAEPKQFDVRGLKEMEAVLNQLGPRVVTRLFRAAFRKALEQMVDAMKRRVPRKLPDDNDYHLREAIKVQLEKKKNRQSSVQFRVGPARETGGEDGYAIKGGLSKSIRAPNYAHIVERETPWMRPALDETANKVLKTLIVEMRKRVIKEVKKAAKKAAKP